MTPTPRAWFDPERHRDRRPLLLARNRIAAAIGPLIRLFDQHFGMDEVRRCDLAMQVHGAGGFVMQGRLTCWP